MDIRRALQEAIGALTAAAVPSAPTTAEVLLMHVLRRDRARLYAHPEMEMTPEEERAYRGLVAERAGGTPTQYLTGRQEFWGLPLGVKPGVFIPRPETEHVVEVSLRVAREQLERADARLVDVGTGTGCIALTLAQQRADAHFKAVDTSRDALELARENAHLNGLDGRVLWLENDLLDGFSKDSVDAVVANPPYIASRDWQALSSSVRDYEPRAALESGPSGMEQIARLAAQACNILVSGGMLFLEFGYDQGEAVRRCLDALGYRNIEIKSDLAGHDRIGIAENP